MKWFATAPIDSSNISNVFFDLFDTHIFSHKLRQTQFFKNSLECFVAGSASKKKFISMSTNLSPRENMFSTSLLEQQQSQSTKMQIQNNTHLHLIVKISDSLWSAQLRMGEPWLFRHSTDSTGEKQTESATAHGLPCNVYVHVFLVFFVMLGAYVIF